MRAILDYLNRRLQQMPRGLSVLTNVFLLFAFLLPAFTLLCLLAYALGTHSVNGVQLSYSEFWRHMRLFTFFGFGIYFAVLAFGLLHATRWSRPLLLLPWVVGPILAVIHHHAKLTLYNYLSGLFSTALLVWYLYFRQTVRDYYAKTHKPVV
jgi:succinate dehydrogenase hydrophobic anchor subunit